MRRGRVIASAILPVLGFAFSASCQAKAYDCLMEPMQTVEISSPVAGVLETVLVKRGDPVKKGQVIATLDSRTERAAMEAAKLRSEAMGPTLTARSLKRAYICAAIFTANPKPRFICNGSCARPSPYALKMPTPP